MNYNFYRAFEILSLSTDGITVEQLEMILPDEFGGKFENKRLNERLKIEALYQASIHNQLNDIKQVELDELLLVPTDLNYKQ